MSASLPALIAPLPTPGLASIALSARAGSLYETRAMNGVSHVLEHLLFNGTAGHPSSESLVGAFERLGAAINGKTDADRVEVSIDLPAYHVPEALGLVGEMWSAPTLAGLAPEKETIAHELREDGGSRYELGSIVRAAIWPGHPLTLPVAGTISGVRRLREDDVRSWHARVCVLENAALAVAGDVDPVLVAEEVDRAFEGCARGPALAPEPAPAFKGPLMKYTSGSDDAAEVAAVFVLPRLGPREDAALTLLSYVLDGGLVNRLRTRLVPVGLTYDAITSRRAYPDAELFGVESATSPRQAGELLAGIFEVLAHLRDEDVPAAERDRALALWEHELRRDALMPELAASSITTTLLYGRAFDDESRLDLARELSAGELREIAGRLFASDRTVVVVRGPRSKALASRIDKEIMTWTT